LPEYGVRRKPGRNQLRERQIIFQHSTVARVGNIEIAHTVHRDTAGQAETVRAKARDVGPASTAVASRGLKVGLSDLKVRVLAVGEAARVVPSQDAVVGAIDYIQMLGRTVEVDGHLARRIEARRAGVVDAVVREVDLAEHRVGDVVTSRRRQRRHHECDHN
jgi:hypothetical protein